MQRFDLELPSGMKVSFRAPRNKDRKDVLEKYLVGEKEKSMTDVELLSSICILALNDKEVSEPDPRKRMDYWSLKDVQFYQGVFLELFFLQDEEDMNKIKDAAKNLLSVDIESV